MNIVAFAGVGIVMCVLLLTVKQIKPDMALLLEVACGVVMTLYLVSAAVPLLEQVRSLSSESSVPTEWMGVALKAIGIGMVVQIASDVCRDAGQSALAGRLEMGGKLALMLVAMPLFQELLSLAAALMGE